jgi:tyrosyl-tRNA synthetase
VPREARIISLLIDTGMATTGNEARRLVAGGGVSLAGERVEDANATVTISEPTVLQVGRRRWARLLPDA